MFNSEGLEVIPEQPDQVPEVSGPLLRRDDKYRWHRRFCRVVPSERKFLVYESPDDTQCLADISLIGAAAIFKPMECDRENVFQLKLTKPLENNRSSLIETDCYFATYSDADFNQWKATLEHLLRIPHSTILTVGGKLAAGTPDDSLHSPNSYPSGILGETEKGLLPPALGTVRLPPTL